MNIGFYRRWIRRTAAFLLLLVLLAAGLLIYLKTAPPSLDFLVETIEARAAQTFPGVRTQIGAIRLVWPFWRIDPKIRLTDLIISDPNQPNARLGGCDRVDLTLSVTDLMGRRIVPRRIALIRPYLDLSVFADLTDGRRPASGSGDAVFPDIRIENGRVIPRTPNASPILVPDARLYRTAAGLRMTLSASQGGEKMDVDARRQMTETGEAQWDMAFVGLRPSMLSDLSDALIHLNGTRLPLKGRCVVRQDAAGRPTRLDLQMAGADGMLSYPWLERDLPVDALSAKISWTAPGPLFLESGRLDFGGTTFHVAGPIDWEGGLPTLALTLKATDIDVADLSAYWPPPAEPEVRQWLVDHFISGAAPAAQADVWLTPDDFDGCRIPCDALSAEVDFSDLVLDYFPPMPRLRAASGHAVFSGCGVDVAVGKGRAANSRVAGGAVRIIGFADHPTQMEIDARVDGPAADLFDAVSDLELEDWAPLFRVTGGRSDTRLGFHFPLQDEFDPDAFQVSVDAHGKSLDLETAWGMSLTDGEASVQYEDDKLAAHGTAALDGVPLSINWEKDQGNGPDGDTVLTVTGAPDRRDFTAWGVPLPKGFDGPIPTTVNLRIKDEETRAAVRFDLSGATFGVRPLGWAKTAGENAALALKLAWRTPDVIQADQVHFYGTDFQVLGSGVVHPRSPGPDWRLDLETVRMGPHRLSSVIGHGVNGYEVDVKGPLFNAMPLLNLKDRGSAPDLLTGDVPLDLHLAVDRILLKNGVEFRGAVGRMRRGRNGELSVSLQGATGPEKPAELALVPATNGLRLRIQAADAGALVKGLGLYDHASDGQLDADFLLTPGPPMRAAGVVQVASFTLREAPTLVEILSLASLEGIVKGLRREGAPFDILRTDLSAVDGVLTIKEGKMEGNALGITFSGTYDGKAREMAIDGIVVPFNLINRAVNAVPLVGKMITGDGIIAVSYRLQGDPDAPAVVVNPASTLLVGSLRNLFDRFHPNRDTD